MNRIFATLLALPLVLWLLNLVFVFLLGNYFDCPLGQQEITACVAFGHDLGDDAYLFALFAAWGPIMLLPWFVGVGVIWGLFSLIKRMRAPQS